MMISSHTLSWFWAIPFVGVLLSIACGPLFTPQMWHKHFGKISLMWALGTVIALLCTFEKSVCFSVISHMIWEDYVPFIVLVGALYIINHGFHVDIGAAGTPMNNTLLLVVGSLLANILGTTGAALLLIHPLLRMNQQRTYKTHTLVFFIFLVCNIAGSLTPIGDPPLFLGFLKGVSFTWPFLHLWKITGFMVIILLGIYWIMDLYYLRKETAFTPTRTSKIVIKGRINILFLGMVLGAVIMSSLWKSNYIISFGGHGRLLENVLRDCIIALAGVLSYRYSSPTIHKQNHLSWAPLQEVAILFAAIFMTAIPVFALLSGYNQHTFSPSSLFWSSGLLSSILDNAPTYLMFFHLIGGDASTLMNQHAPLLTAISCGSVYMGAMSYIGNAPNFMIRGIAEHHNIKMPNFFGYILWSLLILGPLFVLVDLVFLR